MPAIAALLENRAALVALRRTLPKGGPSVVSCRTPASCTGCWTGGWWTRWCSVPSQTCCLSSAELRVRLPHMPLVVYGPFRPDDGELLLACRESVSAVAVEGVDDPIVGELVLRSSITAERRRALADAPRMLRLTETLQRAAWDVLLGEVERPIRTSALAQRLRVSREHSPGSSAPEALPISNA